MQSLLCVGTMSASPSALLREPRRATESARLTPPIRLYHCCIEYTWPEVEQSLSVQPAVLRLNNPHLVEVPSKLSPAQSQVSPNQEVWWV